MKALEAKFLGKGRTFGRQEFDRILKPYAACADCPVVALATDLIEAYPDAKIILVERDVDSWLDSFRTILKHEWHPLRRLTKLEDLIGPLRRCLIGGPCIYTFRISYFVTRTWLGAQSMSQAEDVAKAKYREHYANVRRFASRDRVLEYRLESGWQPLCEFLNVPIPNTPFPKENERQAIESEVRDSYWPFVLALSGDLAILISLAGFMIVSLRWAVDIMWDTNVSTHSS